MVLQRGNEGRSDEARGTTDENLHGLSTARPSGFEPVITSGVPAEVSAPDVLLIVKLAIELLSALATKRNEFTVSMATAEGWLPPVVIVPTNVSAPDATFAAKAVTVPSPRFTT